MPRRSKAGERRKRERACRYDPETGLHIYLNVWWIKHEPKPIPSREFDWHYWHDDYDGAPDSGDDRCGAASSLAAAILAIQAIERTNGTADYR